MKGRWEINDGQAESELLTRAQGGDHDAYAELVRRYSPIAHRTATLLGARSAAENVVQEAFVKAYRALGRVDAHRPFGPWLLQMVANETRNAHRSQRRRGARETGEVTLMVPLSASIDPADVALSHERRDELTAALDQLPDRYRAVVVCRFVLDLDESETSVVLKIPRGTVKSHLHRGLAKLRSLAAATSTDGSLRVRDVS